MLIEGKYVVVEIIHSNHVPPLRCSVCNVNSFHEATDYLKKTFTELLLWDKEDFGVTNVQSVHSDDWRYARIQVPSAHLTREFFVSDMVHDAR